ncbi:MAG TPA: class I SAM-dependent methyltransferase [Casimicrobiaceae bacterium]|nr:class I SAM-dependent methyltransferase [Casimicrobiaceae bacterium]
MFSIEHLHALRSAEIEKIVSHFAPGSRILELGAGTGRQAHELQERGFDIVAVEMAESNYAQARCFPVIDYDGRRLPFEPRSFDIVFSSNVLEHVPDLALLNAEIRRVLRPDGYCVHVMPTHAWRFWTTLTAFPAALQYAATLRSQLLPGWRSGRRDGNDLSEAWLRLARHLAAPLFQRRHGERGNAVSELWLFHPGWWRTHFRKNGFEIVHDEPMGLFYTGHMLFGPRLSLVKRARLAPVVGSACHLFKIRPLPR